MDKLRYTNVNYTESMSEPGIFVEQDRSLQRSRSTNYTVTVSTYLLFKDLVVTLLYMV